MAKGTCKSTQVFTIMHSTSKWNTLMGHWKVKLSRQNGRLLHWPKCSCMSTETKLWKLLLQPAVCMPYIVWLCCGQPEIFTFSYCTWLWNWLIRLTLILVKLKFIYASRCGFFTVWPPNASRHNLIASHLYMNMRETYSFWWLVWTNERQLLATLHKSICKFLFSKLVPTCIDLSPFHQGLQGKFQKLHCTQNSVASIRWYYRDKILKC